MSTYSLLPERPRVADTYRTSRVLAEEIIAWAVSTVRPCVRRAVVAYEGVTLSV
jgi:hypothetical protein